jgi:hypothetical protein
VTERDIAPLGREVVCPCCHLGTMRPYPILAGGRVVGRVTRCSWCHQAEGEKHG